MKAHALMSDASIPPQFWVEVVFTSIYVVCIQPLHGGITLERITPLKRITGVYLDNYSLSLFGCVCYVLLTPHERIKLTS